MYLYGVLVFSKFVYFWKQGNYWICSNKNVKKKSQVLVLHALVKVKSVVTSTPVTRFCQNRSIFRRRSYNKRLSLSMLAYKDVILTTRSKGLHPTLSRLVSPLWQSKTVRYSLPVLYLVMLRWIYMLFKIRLQRNNIYF